MQLLFRRGHIFFAVITRLVRNCALGRVIQYSRDVDARTVKPRRTGYSAFAEYDGGTGRTSGNKLDSNKKKTKVRSRRGR